jgi:hypothetical protein
MRAIGRNPASILICVLLSPLHLRAGDAHADIVDVFAAMTAALVDDNAPGFLSNIDKKCPDYDRLATDIPAILTQGAIASSVDILKDEGDEGKRMVEVDWYLEIRGGPAAPLIQRRMQIRCMLEKQAQGKKKARWRVVEIAPVSIFAPQQYK